MTGFKINPFFSLENQGKGREKRSVVFIRRCEAFRFYDTINKYVRGERQRDPAYRFKEWKCEKGIVYHI